MTAEATPKKQQDKSLKVQRKAKRSRVLVIFGSLIASVLVAFGVFQLLVPQQRIDDSTYQVVYLVTGQAYFGKLKNKSGEYLVLESPFTVQNANVDQEKSKTNTTSLLRVRDQVYGPQDSIAIKSDHVAFWQNLRTDSKVAKVIKEQLAE